jgi:hypothetical protein
MKIVKFKGGLGNQLFQYAFLRYLELCHDAFDVKGDLMYYKLTGKDDVVRKPRIERLKVKINWCTEREIKQVLAFNRIGQPTSLVYKAIVFLEKLFNKKYYFEGSRKHTPVEPILKYEYFDGYWQSWRYVEPIASYLRKEISPNFGLSKSTKHYINIVSQQNAVFMGVRRGDYVANLKTKRHFGTFDEDYYKRGIQYIKERVNNPVFYLFSDDIKWVKDNMEFGVEVFYREIEQQTSDIEELFLMGSCKHAIIVNSTFNWWGAWLIENNNKIVVAPKNWFADRSEIDIIPENWVRL